MTGRSWIGGWKGGTKLAENFALFKKLGGGQGVLPEAWLCLLRRARFARFARFNPLSPLNAAPDRPRDGTGDDAAAAGEGRRPCRSRAVLLSSRPARMRNR